jgi:putative ABC transport system permease protein
MLSIGEGAKREALNKITSLGINTVRIEHADPHTSFGIASIMNLSRGLTCDDATRIGNWLGHRGQVGYYARKDDVSIASGEHTASATVIGVSQLWLRIEGLELSRGRPFVQNDITQMRRVCITGNTIGSRLRLRPGDTIHLQNKPCTVIGILHHKGRLLTEGTGLSTLDFDNLLIMPYNSFPFRKILGSERILDGIVVNISDKREQKILAASRQIEELLHFEHRGVKDYRLVVPLTLLREARETQSLFRLVMGSIAGLSLLVGGIGVMNIMLANVSEHTREIGLRIAVGATRGRILSLYLWHSMLLCLVGGMLGLVGGMLAALAIQNYAGWSVAFSGFAVLLGPLSALLTGLIFGLHPAFRAASLNPAIALREA